jgi:hypothetical protein
MTHQRVIAPDLNGTGLILVACPTCGITAGILPTSTAWHIRCGGVRMTPTDPTAATRARARVKKARRQQRWRNGPGHAKPSTSEAKNPGNRGGLDPSDNAGHIPGRPGPSEAFFQ